MGQVSAGAVWHDTLGLNPRPLVRVEAGGASGALALQAARAYLRAGLASVALVFGAEAAGKRHAPGVVQRVYARSFDAEWDAPAGGAIPSYALSIAAHMRAHGTTEDDFARVVVKNRGAAVHNPDARTNRAVTLDEVLASPRVAGAYKRLDCSPLADGAAAVVLARADARLPGGARRDRPAIAFAASGSATDTVRPGDRDALDHFPAKRLAARRAYQEAAIHDPAAQIDVVEAYDPFSGAELQAIEDLGLAPPGGAAAALAAGRYDPGGSLPVNTSGGLLGMGGAPGATGIAQAAWLARQLRGESPRAVRVEGARVALADTHGGLATQCFVNIFVREP
jgi:acetyl-CoA C-acetyltransferase